jgi:monomeric isocitrate dehydrogenase
MTTTIEYKGETRTAARVDRIFHVKMARSTFYLVPNVESGDLYFMCNSNCRPTGDWFKLDGNTFRPAA